MNKNKSIDGVIEKGCVNVIIIFDIDKIFKDKQAQIENVIKFFITSLSKKMELYFNEYSGNCCYNDIYAPILRNINYLFEDKKLFFRIEYTPGRAVPGISALNKVIQDDAECIIKQLDTILEAIQP